MVFLSSVNLETAFNLETVTVLKEGAFTTIVTSELPTTEVTTEGQLTTTQQELPSMFHLKRFLLKGCLVLMNRISSLNITSQ